VKTLHGLLGMLFVAGAAFGATVVQESGVDGGIYVRIGCDDPNALMAMKADNEEVQREDE